MDRRFVGAVLLIAGVVLQIDELEEVLICGATGLVGLPLAAAGLVPLVWRANPRLLGGPVLIALTVLLVPIGVLAAWPVADNQPGLFAALPIWGMADRLDSSRKIRTARPFRHGLANR